MTNSKQKIQDNLISKSFSSGLEAPISSCLLKEVLLPFISEEHAVIHHHKNGDFSLVLYDSRIKGLLSYWNKKLKIKISLFGNEDCAKELNQMLNQVKGVIDSNLVSREITSKGNVVRHF
jgi:hypothetical protein